MSCNGLTRTRSHVVELNDCHGQIKRAAQTCAGIDCPTAPVERPKNIKVKEENRKLNEPKSGRSGYLHDIRCLK